MSFVYITCKDKKEAEKISSYLLKNQLVACTNVFPISSSYRWKGKIVKEKEYVLLAKTTKQKYSAIKREVKKIHSYELPCISLIESKETLAFEQWMKGEL